MHRRRTRPDGQRPQPADVAQCDRCVRRAHRLRHCGACHLQICHAGQEPRAAHLVVGEDEFVAPEDRCVTVFGEAGRVVMQQRMQRRHDRRLRSDLRRRQAPTVSGRREWIRGQRDPARLAAPGIKPSPIDVRAAHPGGADLPPLTALDPMRQQSREILRVQ